MSGRQQRALDTSIAIPLIYESSAFHESARAWSDGFELRLSGHALAETYAVVTRMPDDARLTPVDAAEVIDSLFAEPILLPNEKQASVPHLLAGSGVTGGATYDALIGLAALEHGLVLATRDARAISTYRAIGAEIEIVGDVG